MFRYRYDFKDFHRETFPETCDCGVWCSGCLLWYPDFNLYNLQIRQHHYYTTRSNENDIKMLPVAPTRGIIIYDRNGIPGWRKCTSGMISRLRPI
ncbi:hypothetical protein KCP76_20955 [Salmonella enterica subsp. enterica serovar Weltevreden]|nr:hypothetical protein KCP76_20955 [Salmonella enterica subsp. enterica serovar Weltevreden]